MTQVAEIMSIDVCTVEPQESLRRAAQLMQEHDIGALPVCQDHQLLGMVTDRDITVRGVADGLDADSTTVSDVMSGDVQCCREDQDAQDVMRLMGDRQLRRLPVIDARKNLVGIVALADLATRQGGPIDQTVREISAPGSAAA